MVTNPHVMDGEPLSPSKAWDIRDRFSSDRRVCFIEEPPGFEAEWRRTSSAYRIGHNIWTDAYLVSLCISAGCTLITFDKALGRRKGCEVVLLGNE